MVNPVKELIETNNKLLKMQHVTKKDKEGYYSDFPFLNTKAPPYIFGSFIEKSIIYSILKAESFNDFVIDYIDPDKVWDYVDECYLIPWVMKRLTKLTFKSFKDFVEPLNNIRTQYLKSIDARLGYISPRKLKWLEGLEIGKMLESLDE